MASIENLVEDIYGLFDNTERDFDEGRVTAFGHRLASHIGGRIKEERDPSRIGLSAILKPCKRQVWYQRNHPELGEPLSPETRFKFLFGDIIEELMLFLAEEAGHEVTGRQDTLEVGGIDGHRDAVVDGVLVDVKSASSRSFTKFVSGLTSDNDPFGYINQLGLYHSASKDVEPNRAAFLAVDKQLGKITLDIHEMKDRDYEKEVLDTKRILDYPIPPARGYDDIPDGKSGNRILRTECSYCPFKFACWPNLRVFTYYGGPRFFTVIKKEPRVDEAT